MARSRKPMVSFQINGERQMDNLVAWIDEIEKVTGERRAFDGVQMLVTPRVDDSPETNREILDKLATLDYDFKAIDETEESAIASEFERVVSRRLTTALRKGVPGNGTEISAAAMRSVVRTYGNIVADHIEMAIGVKGDLSPWYKKVKQKLYGFIYPIGKATGQLLENLRSGRTRLLKRGSVFDIFRR